MRLEMLLMTYSSIHFAGSTCEESEFTHGCLKGVVINMETGSGRAANYTVDLVNLKSPHVCQDAGLALVIPTWDNKQYTWK